MNKYESLAAVIWRVDYRYEYIVISALGGE